MPLENQEPAQQSILGKRQDNAADPAESMRGRRPAVGWQRQNTQKGKSLKTMYTRIITATLLVVIFSACSSATQAPLPTETPQPTVAPTFTVVSPTSSPEPEFTATLTPTTGTESDMGTPIPNWEGIPVIPGANEGEPAGFGYLYSVNVTVEEAEQFYMDKMDAEGWSLSKRQTSETSMFGGPATILDFARGNEVVNIMLIFSSTDNYTMVMLTKVK